jgi:hypothetical protein
MMTPIWKAICLSTAVAALLLPAAAQTTTDPTTATPPQTVHQRKLNQQDRIAQGVQNGGLTANEASKLETKEASLTQEKQQMRTADGGHLSSADKHTLHQQQDKLSKQIYKQKHDSVRQKP